MRTRNYVFLYMQINFEDIFRMIMEIPSVKNVLRISIPKNGKADSEMAEFNLTVIDQMKYGASFGIYI